MSDRDGRQAEYFGNRLAKNERHLRKWAKSEGIEALRLFDNDIPEIPLVVEIFGYGKGLATALHIALYERPYEKDPDEEAAWLSLMAKAAAERLGVGGGRVFLKTRRRMRGLEQYERLHGRESEMVVKEAGLSFVINLSEHLDTGLFLDHRPARSWIRAAAAGKRILNLFCYTGSFSVHAAAGGAAGVTSVDLSNTYLEWAARNLSLNGFEGPRYPLVRSDVRSFLEDSAQEGRTWDIIIVDPPTFSNSKRTDEDFDVNRDWPELLGSCARVAGPGAEIWFSSNSRKLRWDPSLCPFAAEDLSEGSVPPDFRDRRIHRLWRLRSAS